MNVELSGMMNDSDLRSGNALVQTSVLRLSRRDVQIGDDVAVDSDVLADLEALGVGDFLAVELPRNLGRWIAASNALDEDGVARVQDFLGESLTDDWWVDCAGRKKKLNSPHRVINYIPYSVLPA